MKCSIRPALSLFRDIEESFAEIYSYYAQVFVEAPAIHDLWQRIARDEKEHADLLAKACEGELGEADWDVPKFRDCRYLLDVVNQNLRRKPAHLAEALRLAIRLEKELQAVHRECVAFLADTAQAPLFSLLLQAEEEHLNKLEEAYRSVLSIDTYHPTPTSP